MRLGLLVVMTGLLWAGDSVTRDAPCQTCHPKQFRAYHGVNGAHGNSMSRALYTAREAVILQKNPRLIFQQGPFDFQIERRGEESWYRVSKGSDRMEAVIAFAFGNGAAGQTYVYQHNGHWYESRISYYQETGKLDLTMGVPPGEPRNVVEAAGREMTPKDVTNCFGCHTTNSIQKGLVDFANLQAGVGCESCHGSAQKHLTAAKAGLVKSADFSMAKLAKMTTEEQSDACGRCHRTWGDIAASGPRGVGNVRFQPYRLANSKCYDAVDRRIACTGCHEPHAKLEKTGTSYDAACTACHSGTGGKKSCPQGKTNCASCHMPRYEIPGSHHLFTDHQIRIVRKDEKYPN